MIEKKLLSAFLHDRSTLDTLRGRLDREVLSDIGKIVLTAIEKFYDIDNEAKHADKEILCARIEQEYPKKFKILVEAINNLEPVSIPNILEEYRNLQRLRISEDLASKLLNGDFGENTKALMSDLAEIDRIEDQDEADGVYIGGKIDDIIETFLPENLIQVHPPNVNAVLGGGVPPGTHIVLFARPEIGKSLFAINMSAEFLSRGRKVLYVGNEDPQAAMRLRFISRLSGMNQHAVMATPDDAWERAYESGFGNLVFVSKGHTSVNFIADLANKYDPAVIVVDQMRNLTPRGRLSKVEALENIASGLRALYKDCGAVGVSITQAGDSASGKSVLTMGDVDFSNTGIPATADVMLGIGADGATESSGIRTVTFVKNKLTGDHSSVLVKFIPSLSMVSGG